MIRQIFGREKVIGRHSEFLIGMGNGGKLHAVSTKRNQNQEYYGKYCKHWISYIMSLLFLLPPLDFSRASNIVDLLIVVAV